MFYLIAATVRNTARAVFGLNSKYFPALVNRGHKSQPEVKGYILERPEPLGPFPVSHVPDTASEPGHEVVERSLLPKNSQLLRTYLAQVVVGVNRSRKH